MTETIQIALKVLDGQIETKKNEVVGPFPVINDEEIEDMYPGPYPLSVFNRLIAQGTNQYDQAIDILEGVGAEGFLLSDDVLERLNIIRTHVTDKHRRLGNAAVGRLQP